MEHRAQDGTINDFDDKWQSRGDGSTYHHMIEILEYAEISNLPLTYCNKCKSKNSAEKAAFSFTRFIFFEDPRMTRIYSAILWPCPDCQLSFLQPCPVKFN